MLFSLHAYVFRCTLGTACALTLTTPAVSRHRLTTLTSAMTETTNAIMAIANVISCISLLKDVFLYDLKTTYTLYHVKRVHLNAL